jgi:hypothetical protein
MRRFIYTTILLIGGALTAQAQQPIRQADGSLRDQYGNQIDPASQPDSLDTAPNVQSLPPKLYMWKLSETLGTRTILPADTISLNFQNTNLQDGINGEYNMLANLGSPRLSRIFFNRVQYEETNMFQQTLTSFMFRPSQFLFTNSNIPYTNLTYYKAGDKTTGEDRFKTYFSVNANKRLAFGFNIDYLYGRGQYQNQNTAYFNGGLFASYIGERYQMQAMYNNFFLRMNENGGIADDKYITRPEDMADGKKEYEANNIPVNLDQTTTRNRQYYFYLTHRYGLGFKREVAPDTLTTMLSKDSIPKMVEVFVPVTSFIHTLRFEKSGRSYRSYAEPYGMYQNNYFYEAPAENKTGMSQDSTQSFSIKNVFGISLLEGFNKYAKAGLTAYISHKYSSYDLMDKDSTRKTDHYTEQEVFIGGELAKRQGKLLHYSINGEVGIMDKALGQFRVNADLDLNFRLWKDTVKFVARSFIHNTLPDFYMRHYHSNHFYWDNPNMDKEFRTRLEGEIFIERWRTHLRAGVENIKNYTYFDGNALPTQYSSNIQVLSATLQQNFKFGPLHWDNDITVQKSSNQKILPLPGLTLYSNLYLLGKLAKKVLTVQIGADVRYFSRYHAPAYMPVTQQFHLQADDDQVEIGGYPIINVYANLQLKRTRIFVMMSHLNQGMGNRNAFLVPHYPINPRQLKLGLSWNFYD